MSLKGWEPACWELIVSMKNGERLSLEQIRTFLVASEEFRFEANNREEVYVWVTRTLVEQEYGGQKREAKGLLRSYVGKMTGLSRAQVTRLIAGYRRTRGVQAAAFAAIPRSDLRVFGDPRYHSHLWVPSWARRFDKAY